MARPRHETFDEAAVNRAVLRKTAGHPLSVYPTVGAVLGGLAVALFGPSVLLVAGVSGGAALGLGSWLINYFFRRQSFAGAYLRRAHAALERETQRKLDHLREELTELEIGQGVAQLDRFKNKLDTLKRLLGQKLERTELTYGRYLGIAEQVYLSAVDNLHQVSLARRAMAAIDPRYIEKRIEELHETEDMSRADNQAELASLQERLELRALQERRISELLSQNETAMTQLDQTSAAIASIQTRPGHTRVDLETAMSDLAEMVARAHKYSSG